MIGIDLSKLAGVYYNDVLVDALVMGNTMVWENKPSEPTQINEPLHFYVNPGDATFELDFRNYGVYLEYSTNKTDWKVWNIERLTVDEAGIYIRGNNPNGFNNQDISSYFVSSGWVINPVQCEGNIMSLLGETITEIPCDYCFHRLFMGFPIETAPVLTAKVLTEGCYSHMFESTEYLRRIEIHATDISAPDCLDGWLNGVSANGTFICDCSVEYPQGIDGIQYGWTVECLKVEEPEQPGEIDPYSYFWFETTEDTHIQLMLDSNANGTLEYEYGQIEYYLSYDGTLPPDEAVFMKWSEHISINIMPGSKLFVRGNMKAFGCSPGSLHFSSEDTTPCVSVCGNLHCLVADPTDTSIDYKYARLFRYMENLVDASKLLLLDDGMRGLYYYMYMFDGCTNLQYLPDLSNTFSDAGPAACPYMFQNCTSLTNIPKLDIWQGYANSYYCMFQGCTGLTQAYVNYYGTLVNGSNTSGQSGCFGGMFKGCSNLNQLCFYIREDEYNTLTSTIMLACFGNLGQQSSIVHACAANGYLHVRTGTGSIWPRATSSSLTTQRLRNYIIPYTWTVYDDYNG